MDRESFLSSTVGINGKQWRAGQAFPVLLGFIHNLGLVVEEVDGKEAKASLDAIRHNIGNFVRSFENNLAGKHIRDYSAIDEDLTSLRGFFSRHKDRCLTASAELKATETNDPHIPYAADVMHANATWFNHNIVFVDALQTHIRTYFAGRVRGR